MGLLQEFKVGLAFGMQQCNHLINEVKEKIYLLNLIDIEKASGKSQQSIKIRNKPPNKVKIDGNFF